MIVHRPSSIFYSQTIFDLPVDKAMFSVAYPTPNPHPLPPHSPLTHRCANATPVRACLDIKMTRRPGIQSSPLSGHTVLSPRLREEFEPSQQMFHTPQPQTRRRIDPRQQMLQSADEKRGLRRNGFLQKIKGQREDKRWVARGDQVVLLSDSRCTSLTSADLVRRLSKSEKGLAGGTSTKSA